MACAAGWSQTRVAFPDDEAFADAMNTLRFVLPPHSEPAATMAGAMFARYRSAGAKRARVVADFWIGAHAKPQCDRLLTPDRGHCRGHFAGCVLAAPAAATVWPASG